MKKLTLLIPVLILVIASCSNDKKSQSDLKEKEEFKTQVIQKEKSIGVAISNKKIKTEEIRTLLKMYDKLYMDNPKDTAMASYLMKGGE
ncbi:MAG: hypothetical protein C0599_01275, partial [Salinivirgaceae bacterium]